MRSSIWLGIKRFYNIVIRNSVWQIGDGSSINFWKDSWLPQPVVDLIGIPEHMQENLTANISDFIHNRTWNFPSDLCRKPGITLFSCCCCKVVIPLFDETDHLVWMPSNSGNLTFKDAYHFIKLAVSILN